MFQFNAICARVFPDGPEIVMVNENECAAEGWGIISGMEKFPERSEVKKRTFPAPSG